MSMFHVGQLVVCVDDEGFCAHGGEILPEKGMVYTIRGIGYDDFYGVTLWLEEIVNKPREYSDGYRECSWRAKRFRPVKTTSIDCFTALLNKTPERQTA